MKKRNLNLNQIILFNTKLYNDLIKIIIKYSS